MYFPYIASGIGCLVITHDEIKSSFCYTNKFAYRFCVYSSSLFCHHLIRMALKAIVMCILCSSYRSFYNCGTFWGRLKMTISCKFNKLLFEKYSD